MTIKITKKGCGAGFKCVKAIEKIFWTSQNPSKSCYTGKYELLHFAAAATGAAAVILTSVKKEKKKELLLIV